MSILVGELSPKQGVKKALLGALVKEMEVGERVANFFVASGPRKPSGGSLEERESKTSGHIYVFQGTQANGDHRFSK